MQAGAFPAAAAAPGYQRDPEAVAAWKTEQYPAVRTEAKKARATIYFVDEAGIRSKDHAGTT